MTVREFFEDCITFVPDKIVFFDVKENVQDSIQSDDEQWFIKEYGTRRIKRINSFQILIEDSSIDITIE